MLNYYFKIHGLFMKPFFFLAKLTVRALELAPETKSTTSQCNIIESKALSSSEHFVEIPLSSLT